VLHRSTNGGAVFTSHLLLTSLQNGMDLILDRTDESRMWVTGFNTDGFSAPAGHFVATVHGGGSSFTNERVGNGEGYCIAQDPNNADRILTGGSAGLFVKDFSGSESWTNLFAASAVRAIAFSSGSAVLVATDNGVYKSDNGTDGWSTVLAGALSDIVSDPSNSNILYCSKGPAVMTSVDEGSSWNDFSTGLDPTKNINNLAISSAGYLFAGTQGDGVFRTQIQVTANISPVKSGSTDFSLKPISRSRLAITIAKSGRYRIIQRSLNGRVLFEKTYDFETGIHRIDLSASAESASGIKVVSVSGAGGIVHCLMPHR